MVHVRISSHADLQALQDRSDERMILKLVSLESVSIAGDSYALLRSLIERRYWQCPQMDLLSLVASVALDLHKMKHDLFPLHVVVQEANLEGGFLKALLLKNSAIAILRLGEDAKEIVEGCVGSLVEEDVLLGKVKHVGIVVEDTANLVLDGTRNFAWLQTRVPVCSSCLASDTCPGLLELVDVLSLTPVIFPCSE